MSKNAKNTKLIKQASAELERALSEFEKLKSDHPDPQNRRELEFRKKIQEIQKKIDYLS